MSAFSIMGERIVKLKEVAQQGNICAFYGLIQEDIKLLEDIDELPFVDTPLHVAAFAGGPQHIQFAMEMMRLKPSFARKPDLNGYSPIHLALQGGHTQMVCRLLQVDGDLVRVKGKEGRTPLHDVAAAVATEQQLDLLFKFLSDCPNSIEDVTIQNQTALHIALENNNLGAFKLLVGWLRENKSENAILNWQDENGNTILHVAAVRHLLAWGGTSFKVNEKNLKGKTALDILQGQPQEVDNSEMRDILDCAGALTASSLLTVTPPHAHYLSQPVPGVATPETVVKEPLSDEKRNALLVVAALLITVTYQAILSPPGGLWQDNDLSKPNTTSAALGPPSPAGGLFNVSNSNITAPHRAGSTIAGTESSFPFGLFLTFNSIIFLSAIAATFFLVTPVGLGGAILAGVSLSLYYCYFNSLIVITHAPDWTVNFVLLLPLIVIAALIFALKGIGYLRNLRRN
ncbi:ankyrin repeat-containing protein bda1 [Quercus suber]|uniref:Ankyrin repeat-containing protein bda1 n=1 Tax=Quercus suber TaxID=58331 RepID=A0AAW0JBF0_QUESU